MKKRNFFYQKQTAVTATIVALTAVVMTGVYINANSSEPKEPETAYVEETETEQTAPASSVIRPKDAKEETETSKETETQNTQAELAEEDTESISEENVSEKAEEAVQETGTTSAKTAQTGTNLHFSEEAELLWPVNGNVIMSYSMDQTAYFATLQQYKYNPAVIIAGEPGEEVVCAADGIITEITENEETGCTVEMDLGDGYTAVYGQLKDITYKEGAYVSMGETIGYVAEPTKYYSVEGSNLYFKLEKDEMPIDPILYFE